MIGKLRRCRLILLESFELELFCFFGLRIKTPIINERRFSLMILPVKTKDGTISFNYRILLQTTAKHIVF